MVIRELSYAKMALVARWAASSCILVLACFCKLSLVSVVHGVPIHTSVPFFGRIAYFLQCLHSIPSPSVVISSQGNSVCHFGSIPVFLDLLCFCGVAGWSSFVLDAAGDEGGAPNQENSVELLESIFLFFAAGVDMMIAMTGHTRGHHFIPKNLLVLVLKAIS